MAQLIKSKEQLKETFSALDINAQFTSFKSFVEEAEEDYLIEALDDEVILWASGNLTSTNPKIKRVVDLLLRAEAYLSIFKWSHTALYRFTDKALYIAKMSDGAIISDKKLQDLRNFCKETGFNSIDRAIGIMEKNLSLFPTYAESGKRLETQKHFIRTAEEFSRIKNIENSRITFLSLLPLLEEAENDYLSNYMGEGFYQTFKEKFLDGDLTPTETKLLPYISKSTALLATSIAFERLPVQVSGNGIYINSYTSNEDYEQKTSSNSDQNEKAAKHYFSAAENTLVDLKKYLNKNAALYPGFVPNPVVSLPINTNNGFYYG